ncbi:uncharacterized protein F4812DRAFT_454555 [Daldinia caldariorum]|uniref:uncharacterized protein n=1 Tax=Daldinia caldariorum TaxID=326644 RepID=UPI0020085D09|nr:uncharacterized protein F4812DRAFT_454555 [Daldinia caldariorum]KAI1472741.1 hypothetical protein F4812DRAFT_454555 [Daldinia caldariorum]
MVEEVFVESSYSVILRRIAKSAIEQADITLEAKIVLIDTLRYNTSRKVTLRTEVGKEYDFDQVVITTPLGWLQKNMARESLRHVSLRVLDLGRDDGGFLPRVHELAHAVVRARQQPARLAPGDLKTGRPRRAQQAPDHPLLPVRRLLAARLRRDPRAAEGQEVRVPAGLPPALLRAAAGSYYNTASGACAPTAILATEWLKDDLCGNASYCNFQVGVEEADQDISSPFATAAWGADCGSAANTRRRSKSRALSLARISRGNRSARGLWNYTEPPREPHCFKCSSEIISAGGPHALERLADLERLEMCRRLGSLPRRMPSYNDKESADICFRKASGLVSGSCM